MDSQPPADVIYAADTLGAAELDALPYGMIQLDAHGRILRYSQAETRLSGRAAADVVGRDFFTDVAPCTHVREFFGRFQQGVAAAQLDAVFNFRFAFTPPRDVRVHMFYSRVTRSVWVKVVDLGAVGPGAAGASALGVSAVGVPALGGAA
jgi:photoactive yellow protein